MEMPFIKSSLAGPMVQWLAHRTLNSATWVQIPVGPFYSFLMSQNIDSFFKKKETAADKRKAALAKRQQLLEKLNIPSVSCFFILLLQIVSDVSKPKRVTKKKKHEEAIPLEPVRKSRRLQGAAPEFIPDDFILGEAKPFIPTSFEKEQEAEKEGTIVFLFIIFNCIVI